ncbi:hypothetical protein WS63_03220 [Burkholderia stagnalis]|nr:hypothetical protein WS63_03220 [Burkholderia stagnalis]
MLDGIEDRLRYGITDIDAQLIHRAVVLSHPLGQSLPCKPFGLEARVNDSSLFMLCQPIKKVLPRDKERHRKSVLERSEVGQ